jgi:hypothetical protein
MGLVSLVNKDSRARPARCGASDAIKPKPSLPRTLARPDWPNNQQKSNLGKQMQWRGHLHFDTAICAEQIAARWAERPLRRFTSSEPTRIGNYYNR